MFYRSVSNVSNGNLVPRAFSLGPGNEVGVMADRKIQNLHSK